MKIFPELPLRYSLRATGELEAEAKGTRVGSLVVLGMLIIIPAIAKASSMKLVLLIIAGLGPIAFYYFMLHEYLFISATHIEYRLKSLLSSRSVRAERKFLIGIRLFKPHYYGGSYGGPPKTYEVELIFSGDQLPSSLKLFESMKEPSARNVAHQLGSHLSLPVRDDI